MTTSNKSPLGTRLPSRAGFRSWLILAAGLLAVVAAMAVAKEREHRDMLVERLQAYELRHPEHRSAVQVLVSCRQTLWNSDSKCGKALYASEGDTALTILAQMASEDVFR